MEVHSGGAKWSSKWRSTMEVHSGGAIVEMHSIGAQLNGSGCAQWRCTVKVHSGTAKLR